MKAIVGKSYLTEIPHEEGKLSFQHPAFKGTYGNVAEQIDKAGLKRPNSPETASLVYDAFQNKDEKYESEIISILKDNWFWEFTGNLYLPKSNEEINNGVLIEYNPKIENGKLIMNKNSLIKRLQSNDPLVKFVPFGYKIEKQSSLELSKNPYIVARYGEEGAEKIAEVASKYENKPHVWNFNSVDEEKVRMSALNGGWDFDDRLYVGGCDWNDGSQVNAFGVCKEY
ncbi:MAG: hypothetical protein QT10_C0001G0168 [archaeon GW2011_AR19]|nr:MAG: hypothetical protein QT10_C0001G0168 [archaeon GW2011_AR19]